jgi:hypothetical protein
VIKKIGNQYRVVAHSGRSMGTYPTMAKAQVRLKQVEMFKGMRAHGVKLRGSR